MTQAESLSITFSRQRIVLESKGNTPDIRNASLSLETRQRIFDRLFLNTLEVSADQLQQRSVSHEVSEEGSRLTRVLYENLYAMRESIPLLDRMFDGPSSEERIFASMSFLEHRRSIATNVFQQIVRPGIERLLLQHDDARSFDEIACIYGFNRLFTRETASAGTDIDFMLVIDTDNPTLIDDIRLFLRSSIQPELASIGIDMEAADYLMIDLNSYLAKLDVTRKALFTLANMPIEGSDANVHLLTGSSQLLRRIFTFTDNQLAEHYVALLLKNGYISEAQKEELKTSLIVQLTSGSASFRNQILDSLKNMANSELYIGKTPYKGKKTIQTILSKVSVEERESRTIPFSIKFCLNRITDLLHSTSLKRSSLTREFPLVHFENLERLGIILSNIVCRINSDQRHPLLIMQTSYSDITLDNLRSVEEEDRRIIAQLVQPFGIMLDAESIQFPENCYDALWNLADIIHETAQSIEDNIFRDALTLIS